MEVLSRDTNSRDVSFDIVFLFVKSDLKDMSAAQSRGRDVYTLKSSTSCIHLPLDRIGPIDGSSGTEVWDVAQLRTSAN